MADLGDEPPILDARALRVDYRRGGAFDRGASTLRALDGVDMTVDRGSITALIGPSGSGKSTLGRCLALLEPPTAGEIRLEGRPTGGFDRRALATARRRVQLVFQDAARSVARHFDVATAIGEPLRVGGRSAGASRDRITQLLAEVDLDEGLANRPIGGLSGGQLRRAILARALATEPDVLVLDEALTGLDPSLVARLVDLLLDLRERRGLTYVLISHDHRLVDHLADRVVRLERGRVVD
ncbi:MAG: ATP-binding cassette domain-containing protein [Acidobacteriota bacterium]